MSNKRKPSAYSIETRNYTMNIAVDWHANTGEYPEEEGSGWFSSEKVRLFPNDPRIRFQNKVHELVEYSLQRAGITVKKCRVPVHHYGHLDTGKSTSKGENYLKLGIEKLRQHQSPKAVYELAVQATILESYNYAVQLWNEYMKHRPDDVKSYLNLTKIYGELGNLTDAVRVAGIALKLAPEMPEAVFNYAVSRFYLGELDEAKRVLQEYIIKNPEYPMTLALLSLICLITGDDKAGAPMIGKIRRMGFKYHEYLFCQAKKLISVNQMNNARALLQGAIAGNIVSLDILGLISEIIEAN